MSHPARGALTLFNDLFETSVASQPINNASLRERKVDCLIDYYYYTFRNKGLAYVLLIEEVSNAFFLSAITIHDILQKNRDQLLNLKKEWKDMKIEKLQRHMVKKWPHLVW